MEITKKDLSDIIEKRFFSAGKEFLTLALEKLELKDVDKIEAEDAFSAFEMIKGMMHTQISKDAMDSCIEDLKNFVSSSEGEE